MRLGMGKKIEAELMNDYALMKISDCNEINKSMKIEEAFREIVAQNQTVIIVDIKELSYYDTLSSPLLHGMMLLSRISGKMVLIVSEYWENKFTITKLGLVIPFFRELEEAKAALGLINK